ncbi:BCCT family transporter, partial [Sporosarcina sp. NCCP-2222]|uniref:BCCT family transporter n=1 Tax=Sporosarcina sp. NCCP-2222 TaxID=2935073 RepID=UPI0020BDA95F
ATWGILMAAIVVVLINSSGLAGLQTASLVAALPFTVILLLMGVALLKMLRADQGKATTEETETANEKESAYERVPIRSALTTPKK